MSVITATWGVLTLGKMAVSRATANDVDSDVTYDTILTAPVRLTIEVD